MTDEAAEITRKERDRERERERSPEKDSSSTFVMKSVFLSHPRWPRQRRWNFFSHFIAGRERERERDGESGVALKVVGHRELGGWRGWSHAKLGRRYACQRVEPLQKRAR